MAMSGVPTSLGESKCLASENCINLRSLGLLGEAGT